jgi:ubiquinone/menaquinone biosynthesis C-methylase UbiE
MKMVCFRRLKWALRKLILPVHNNDLVLDVGSGGNPYPRADVLLDRLVGAEHRCGAPMLIDRPTVFGDGTKLPFKDKAFDFVIASHILEHMSDPSSFLNELQRVGKAGYIETPNFIFERLIPMNIHCLEIAVINGVFHIHKKKNHIEDLFIGNLSFMDHNSEWKNLLFKFCNELSVNSVPVL